LAVHHNRISKALPVIKWTESFRDFLNRVIGVRTIPVCYVIRETVIVPAIAPAMAQNQPHSNEHESVTGELVARASHEHALFRDDNASVCSGLNGNLNTGLDLLDINLSPPP
jgi:hypothetical protein